jgi:hypothetical protein
VADIHLIEPLVQGRDQHRRPEKVDGAEALAVSQQPVGKRLARSLVVSPGQAGQAIRHKKLVARTQEVGTQEAAGQMKRGWSGAGPEPRDPPLGTQEDHRRLATEHRIDSDPPAEVSQVGATGHTHVLAVVDQLAGHRVVKGAGAPSQPRPAFQQGDPQTAIDQARRGRQARQAPADNDNMRRRRLVGRCHKDEG